MNTSEKYLQNTHRYGRIATFIAIAIMLGIPAIVSTYYGIWPRLAEVFVAAGPLLAMFIPVAIAENISLAPVMGTSVYLNSILGNVMNIKFPCYMNTIEKIETTPGTEVADAMGMCSVCLSGMVTMIIVGFGVLLMVPLKPILTSETVTVATNYIMPALYGSMGVMAFTNTSAGEYKAKGKPIIALIAVGIILFANYFITPLAGKEGYAMLIMIILTTAIAYVLYQKGIVKVLDE